MRMKQLALQTGNFLKMHGLKLATAESCTGGFVAQVVTSIAGSSNWFDRGFVTYTNLAKMEMLGVRLETLNRYGAVSEQTACEMAQGAIRHSHADLSIAITGIAGPSGGTLDKPVGTVWIAFGAKTWPTSAICYCFSGNRSEIRAQAVQKALSILVTMETNKHI